MGGSSGHGAEAVIISADHELLRLGVELDQCWERERAVLETWARLPYLKLGSSPFDKDPEAGLAVESAHAASAKVAERICNTRAVTMKGLQVKAWAFCWVNSVPAPGSCRASVYTAAARDKGQFARVAETLASPGSTKATTEPDGAEPVLRKCAIEDTADPREQMKEDLLYSIVSDLVDLSGKQWPL